MAVFVATRQPPLPLPTPALSDHIQMEMQNVKFEKRAKRLKLIRLGTGCPGTTASHFSKRTEGQLGQGRLGGQGTDITSRLALSFFRFPPSSAIVAGQQNAKSPEKMKVAIESNDDFYLNDSTD